MTSILTTWQLRLNIAVAYQNLIYFRSSTMVINLTQKLINFDLQQYANGKRTELVSDERTGLYVEVRPSGNGVGTYYLRYKDNKGKSCHERLGRTNEISLSEARQKVALLKSEIEDGKDINAQKPTKKGDMLLNDFWDIYYEFAKSTKRSFKRDFQLFSIRLAPKLGDLKLSEITVRQIQTLMMDVRKEGLSGASADHHGQLMRRMGNLAVKWGYLDVNFANGIQLYHEFNEVNNIPSEEQFQKLLHVLNTDKNRPICRLVLFLLSTGCRLNEALSAQWKNISFANRILTVPHESSKTKRPRHIFLNDAALNILKQIDKRSSDTYVFTNAKTNKPFVTVFKPWNRIRVKAGLPNFRLHDCRHQFSTTALENGCSLHEVSQLMGHVDSRMVEKRYSHLSSSTMLAAANSVSKKLSGFTQPQLEVV